MSPSETKNRFSMPHSRLGILGGGQLGKMLVLAAHNWGIHCSVLDTHPEQPAASVCPLFLSGDFRNFDSVLAFGRTNDIITIEIEDVNLDALKVLEAEGKAVFPRTSTLEIIQDKAEQNRFLQSHKLPTAPFWVFDSVEEIRSAVRNSKLHFPFIQKLRRAGYDGQGVFVVKNQDDLNNLMPGGTLVETCVNIKKEISVIVARNLKGELAVYSPVEMVFNKTANLVEHLVCPAELDETISKQAEDIAKTIASALDLIGVLAVEMFLDTANKLWVNELAPRPHNSGHHTIESCLTSQYEQHLRAVFNLPLGSTALICPSVMVNILGEPGFSGAPVYVGLEDCLSIEGVKVHLYGKKVTRPYRKMGHVTILDNNKSDALKKAERVKLTLRVKA